VIASGGLSYQLDGERAGFINKAFDLQFLNSLESNPEWITQFSVHELVKKTGIQGVELLMWVAMRGVLAGLAAPRCAGMPGHCQCLFKKFTGYKIVGIYP
jgi:protocatechuate 4,5-dioxygenase beta chain